MKPIRVTLLVRDTFQSKIWMLTNLLQIVKQNFEQIMFSRHKTHQKREIYCSYKAFCWKQHVSLNYLLTKLNVNTEIIQKVYSNSVTEVLIWYILSTFIRASWSASFTPARKRCPELAASSSARRNFPPQLWPYRTFPRLAL